MGSIILTLHWDGRTEQTYATYYKDKNFFCFCFRDSRDSCRVHDHGQPLGGPENCRGFSSFFPA